MSDDFGSRGGRRGADERRWYVRWASGISSSISCPARERLRADSAGRARTF